MAHSISIYKLVVFPVNGIRFVTNNAGRHVLRKIFDCSVYKSHIIELLTTIRAGVEMLRGCKCATTTNFGA